MITSIWFAAYIFAVLLVIWWFVKEDKKGENGGLSGLFAMKEEKRETQAKPKRRIRARSWLDVSKDD